MIAKIPRTRLLLYNRDMDLIELKINSKGDSFLINKTETGEVEKRPIDEWDKYVNDMLLQNHTIIMNHYSELKEPVYAIEDCVEKLQKYNSRGEFVCFEFNGHMLYSDTVTLDSAFLEITGLTKSEHDKRQQEYFAKLEMERAERAQKAQDNIPNWIEKGHTAFSEDKWKTWDVIVPIRAKDIYYGMELDCTLQIQEILATGNLEGAKIAMEEQDHSGTSWYLMRSMVKEFCTNGEEFIKYLDEKEHMEQKILETAELVEEEFDNDGFEP